ncbi:MAG: SPASM domain-containing protein [Candidatus Rokubacteria bacterium]|nr:SPASM domain-containing protein [Candidatus Rokubacteria bacterium]
MSAPSRPAVAPELPRTLYLETTNRCDSRCQTCIRTFQTLEPPKDLTLAELQRVVDQLPGLERVVLHGIGEPLLNRELVPMIAYLKARGVYTLFNSDAITLTPTRARELIESGLDEYRVSMDAATAETYRRIRGVPRFERVVRNVRGLVALQRELERTTPRVSLWFTAMRANLEELPAFVRLAAELGVAEVYVQRLVYWGRGLAVEGESLHRRLQAREEARLAEAEALARAAGLAFRASGLTAPLASLRGAPDDGRPWAGCQRPWSLAYVTANGHVLPCCIAPWTARDYAGAILGHAFEQPFAEIWNGERYQRFRRYFESDTPPDPCRGCGRLWSL